MRINKITLIVISLISVISEDLYPSQEISHKRACICQRISLHEAAASGQDEIIRRLLADGANIEAQNNEQETPLHLAARNGHAEAIKILLEVHANTESQR